MVGISPFEEGHSQNTDRPMAAPPIGGAPNRVVGSKGDDAHPMAGTAAAVVVTGTGLARANGMWSYLSAAPYHPKGGGTVAATSTERPGSSGMPLGEQQHPV